LSPVCRDDEFLISADAYFLALVAESFSLTPSEDPPTIYDLELGPPKGIPKPDWAPEPNFTRPIPLTASICLDFAQPSPFRTLHTRPALILGPARTWHASVGRTMWEHARQRAEEVESLVLWCDGGEGGFSGVAGRGMREPWQVGAGSWTRRIGVEWPFGGERTVYAWEGGDWATFLVLVGVTAVGQVVGPGLGFNVQRVQEWMKEWRERRGVGRARETTPLLH
jgi:hypothetical protein